MISVWCHTSRWSANQSQICIDVLFTTYWFRLWKCLCSWHVMPILGRHNWYYSCSIYCIRPNIVHTSHWKPNVHAVSYLHIPIEKDLSHVIDQYFSSNHESGPSSRHIFAQLQTSDQFHLPLQWFLASCRQSADDRLYRVPSHNDANGIDCCGFPATIHLPRYVFY